MMPDKLSLKRATLAMVRAAGGVEAASNFVRVGKSKLADNYAPHREDSFVALDVVADLEPLTRGMPGWPHVTGELCRQMGGMFVARPEVTASGAEIMVLLARHSQEAADVTRSLCEGLADGKFDADDAARTRVEVRQAMEQLAAIDAELAAIEQESRA